MNLPRPFASGLSLTIAVLLAPAGFGQGSLTPPPGPPAPTMKTLDQVEARTIVNATNAPGDATSTFIIRAPGSYYLTGNVTGASGKHGVTVLANNVTLDLNGFALISGGGGGAARGVNTTTAITGLSIRNGSVRGWTGGGVRADFAVTRANDLTLSDNVGAIGLAVGSGSLVKDCVANANGTGFYLPDRTQASNCVATMNSGRGFDCTSFVNLTDCTSSSNGGGGIVVVESSSLIRCTVSKNSSTGISAGLGCTILDCTISSNGFIGIYAGSGSTVRGCTATDNGSFGIIANDDCHIIGNTCVVSSVNSFSGGGIQATGNGNRIEANSCRTKSGFGILAAPGINNLVVRNSVHGNATGAAFFFAADNRYGAVVDLTAPNPNTGVGNSAPSSIGTTDPWANFAY